MLKDQQRRTALISYSHDCAEHEARVLALANRLRADGIDCDLDQYVAGGAPPEGWPRWMQSRIEQSDFTLMVCSAVYARRVLRLEPPDVGRGVIWEANLLYNLLYHDSTFKRRTVPVLLEGGAIADIPLPFRDSYCDLRSEAGYRDLLQRLFGVPRALKPELGHAFTLSPAADEPVRRLEKEVVVATPTPHLDQALLNRLQTLLVDVLGPIARHLVTGASQRASSVSDLIDELVAEIPDKKDAEAFRAKARTAVHREPSELTSRLTWDPGMLDRARKELAAYIGPMATFIVERACAEARSRTELFEALSAEIPSAKDRKRFLAALASRPDRVG